jgi:hypothetical protein
VIPRKLQNVVYIKKIDVKNKGKKGAIIGSCPRVPVYSDGQKFKKYETKQNIYDKQQSTKHTHKTKDRVTRSLLKFRE